MARLLAFFVCLLTLGEIALAQTNAAGTPSTGATSPSNANIIEQGWLRYFIMNPSVKARPSRFFLNPDWAQNPSLRANTTSAKDQYGPMHIPSEQHFYFMLKPDVLYVSTVRNTIRRVVEALDVKKIDPFVRGPSPTGGIEDQGNFKEGHCFALRSSGAGSEREQWEVCADTYEAKTKWIASLMTVITEKKNDTAFATTPSQSGSQSFDVEPQIDYSTLPAPDKTPADGKWTIIQDWGVCSVKCGGGISVRQRFCIPPRNGGKPCEGQATETRTCNMDPCPQPTISLPPITAPPQIKVVSIVSKPAKYIDCALREGDMTMAIIKEGRVTGRIPVVVVLNNRTLTAFERDNMDSVKETIDLGDISEPFLDFPDDKNCFTVTAPRIRKELTLCVIGPTATLDAKTVREHWMMAISHFKHDCESPLKLSALPQDLVKAKMQELAQQVAEQKAQAIDVMKESRVEQKLEIEVQAAAQQAMASMQKELIREQLEEQEELMREKAEQQALELLIQEEQKKKECVEKQLQATSQRKRFTKRQDLIRQKIQDIETQAQAQLKIKQARQQKRLQQMRKKAHTKRAEATRRLQIIREEITKQVLNAEREGNATVCYESFPEKQRQAFCNFKFANEPDRLVPCRDPDQFCQICCEEEFGSVHEDERGSCESSCNSRNDGAKAEVVDDKGGRWVWVPEENRVGGGAQAAGVSGPMIPGAGLPGVVPPMAPGMGPGLPGYRPM